MDSIRCKVLLVYMNGFARFMVVGDNIFVYTHAYHSGKFRWLHNKVNRERKLCQSRYFNTKVANLKTTKPSQWCVEVKKIAGMAPATGMVDI